MAAKKEELKKETNQKKNVVKNKKNVKVNKDKKGTKKVVKSAKKQRNVELKVLDDNIKEKLEKVENVNIIDGKNDNDKEISFSLFEVILLIIITILSCILIGDIIKPEVIEKVEIPEAPDDNIADKDENINYEDIQTFLEQYNYIVENYYGELDKEQLMKDAINGMFSSLDDYSEVIGNESNSFTISLQGEYEGVGIVIYNDELGNIIIDEVYEQTPAYKAGLRANDVIIKFNDMSLENVSTSQLVEYIASSNEMTLTVLRDSEQKVFNLKREKVVLQSVNHKMIDIDKKMGYIDIDIFALNTPEQFENALTELEKNKIKSLIIDLRDNTGGHLSAVEEMLYSFLSKSHVIYQTEDKNGVEKFYSKGTKDKKYEIVILQNGASASASEIMAAALSEELDAYIIGNNSFGKGTVQTLKDVGADLQYKFTTKRWLTPKGNWVHGVGIKPDLEVDLTNEYYTNPTDENDTQLQAAIKYLNK